jgi:hypothetical protein
MPRGEAEARLVRQYALLWHETEPEQLPTHYFGGLAMCWQPTVLEIKDAQGAKAYEQIVKGIAAIVNAYEEPEGGG